MLTREIGAMAKGKATCSLALGATLGSIIGITAGSPRQLQ